MKDLHLDSSVSVQTWARQSPFTLPKHERQSINHAGPLYRTLPRWPSFCLYLYPVKVTRYKNEGKSTMLIRFHPGPTCRELPSLQVLTCY